MIGHIKAFFKKMLRKDHVVVLGQGLTKISVKDDALLLTPIEKSISGGEPGAEIKGAEKVIVQFSNIKSVDIMIAQLEDLRHQMANRG